MRVRAMLVERCGLGRSGLRRTLHADRDIEVVADVDSVCEALRVLADHEIDVVVISTTLERDERRTAALDALRDHPGVRIVCVSHWTHAREVDEAIRSGVLGVVEVGGDSEADLARAVRLAHRGEGYLSPRLATGVVQAVEGSEHHYARLTVRERQVLGMVARSKSNREIARELSLSVNTVAVHRNHIMRKLGVRKATALAVFAAERGLLTRIV